MPPFEDAHLVWRVTFPTCHERERQQPTKKQREYTVPTAVPCARITHLDTLKMCTNWALRKLTLNRKTKQEHDRLGGSEKKTSHPPTYVQISISVHGLHY